MQNLSKKLKKVLTKQQCYAIIYLALLRNYSGIYGEVSEWFMELVLKTSDLARDRGFESLLLRQFFC